MNRVKLKDERTLVATNKQLTEEQVKAEVEPKVLEVKGMEVELAKLEIALAKNSQFRKFLDLQAQLKETSDTVWSNVLEQMVNNDVKSIKGSWGSITVAEKKVWKTTDELPTEFTKIVADDKKLTNVYQLTGEAPVGAELSVTKYLHKRFK